MTIRDQLALNLAYYRKKAGLTQKGAASALGTKPTTLSSWERAASQPDADMLVSIALLYKVTLSDLCGMDYDMNITPEEHEIIEAYRRHPEHHLSIRALLGVREKTNSVLDGNEEAI